eukprot:52247-Eustigmatos_ZCMA.PRE.1
MGESACNCNYIDAGVLCSNHHESCLASNLSFNGCRPRHTQLRLPRTASLPGSVTGIVPVPRHIFDGSPYVPPQRRLLQPARKCRTETPRCVGRMYVLL